MIAFLLVVFAAGWCFCWLVLASRLGNTHSSPSNKGFEDVDDDEDEFNVDFQRSASQSEHRISVRSNSRTCERQRSKTMHCHNNNTDKNKVWHWPNKADRSTIEIEEPHCHQSNNTRLQCPALQCHDECHQAYDIDSEQLETTTSCSSQHLRQLADHHYSGPEFHQVSETEWPSTSIKGVDHLNGQVRCEANNTVDDATANNGTNGNIEQCDEWWNQQPRALKRIHANPMSTSTASLIDHHRRRRGNIAACNIICCPPFLQVSPETGTGHLMIRALIKNVSTDCVQLIIPNNEGEQQQQNNIDNVCHEQDLTDNNIADQTSASLQNQNKQPSHEQQQCPVSEQCVDIDKNNDDATDSDSIDESELNTHAKIEHFRQLERQSQHQANKHDQRVNCVIECNSLKNKEVPNINPLCNNRQELPRSVRGIEAINRRLSACRRFDKIADNIVHNNNNSKKNNSRSLEGEEVDDSDDTMSWSSASTMSPMSPAMSMSSDNNQQDTGSNTKPNSTFISVKRISAKIDAENACQLIPKLIDRLDRKLNVMKHERVALDGDTQANEAAGQRLFEVLKAHLTYNEFDKVRNHANETEKVTRLLLTLKSRLAQVQRAITQANCRASMSQQQVEQQQQCTTLYNDSQTNSVEHQQQQHNDGGGNQRAAALMAASQSPISGVRGVSDPTGERQHPVRRPVCPQRRQTSTCCTAALASTDNVGVNHSTHVTAQTFASNKTMNSSGSSITSGTGSSSGADTGSDDGTHHSTTSSMFNSTDSAIGSALTECSSPATLSSPTPSLVHHHHHDHNSEQLSHDDLTTANNPTTTGTSGRSMKVAKQLSMSLSHLAHLQSASASFDDEEQQQPNQGRRHHNSNVDNDGQQPDARETMLSVLCELDILASKRDKLKHQLDEAHQLEAVIERRNDAIVNKILMKYFAADCNSYHSQLASPNDTLCNSSSSNSNNNSIERSLSSHNDHHPNNNANVIDEFRQYIRLKSLLIKETRELNERIENAERQLIELKQQLLIIS